MSPYIMQLNTFKRTFLIAKKVIFHDSARPFINYNIINNYVDLLEENDAVITAVKITDSIGKLDGEPIDRN